MHDPQQNPEPAKTIKSRWRFTLRHVLWLFVFVGIGLFLYRELPNYLRAKVYNDPVTLSIGDRNKIHLRQIPYSTYGFQYRIYLPANDKFELCVAETTNDRLLPTPGLVLPFARISGDANGVEYVVQGCVDLDRKAKTARLFIQEISRPDGHACSECPGSLSITYLGDSRGPRMRMHGLRGTEVFDPQSEIILYRRIWGKVDSFAENEWTKGPGVVVWVRAASKTPAPMQ